MKRKELIRRITEFHPAHGVEYGLSTYVGGMRDSGYWYEGRLLMLKKGRLKKFLDRLVRDSEDKKVIKESSGEITVLSNGVWFYNEEADARKRFEEGLERFWLKML